MYSYWIIPDYRNLGHIQKSLNYQKHSLKALRWKANVIPIYANIFNFLTVELPKAQLYTYMQGWVSQLELGPKWTVQRGESGRSRDCGRSVQNWTILSQTGRSSKFWRSFTFIPKDRLEKFGPSRPSSFHSKDRLVSALWTVHFRGPSSLSLLDRPVSFLTVHF